MGFFQSGCDTFFSAYLNNRSNLESNYIVQMDYLSDACVYHYLIVNVAKTEGMTSLSSAICGYAGLNGFHWANFTLVSVFLQTMVWTEVYTVLLWQWTECATIPQFDNIAARLTYAESATPDITRHQTYYLVLQLNKLINGWVFCLFVSASKQVMVNVEIRQA